jgi:glycosyl transferase, family 25
MKSIQDIDHVYYINLDTRPDRKTHVESQLDSIGIKQYTRFSACMMANGAIGCSTSHLKILEMAREQNLPHVLIVEDDIEFTKPDVFVKQINQFLSHNDPTTYDVLLLAGNNIPPYKKHGESSVQVSHCQTTTSYLVQSHYYDTLIKNFTESLEKLVQYPDQPIKYAIDKFWIQLQKRHRWYLIIPLTIVQKPDFSDIEKRDTNYNHLMLDLDKKQFIQKMGMNLIK